MTPKAPILSSPVYPAKVRYVHFKKEVIELLMWTDGLWRSNDGCVWGFRDEESSVDSVDRPGIGLLSWPMWAPGYEKLVDATRPHEYQYSSPAYQAFHTRSEADASLKNYIKMQNSWIGALAQSFKQLATWFGKPYWENKTTRNK